MRAVPHEIKLSIGVGIGLFIALVGLPRRRASRSTTPRRASASASSPAAPPLIALAGLLVMIILTARGVQRGDPRRHPRLDRARADLRRPGRARRESSSSPTSSDFSTIGDALKPDNLLDALTWALVPVIFVLFMSDFFDTIGTAVAVSSAGGLLDEHGQPPRLQAAAAGRLRGRRGRRRDGRLERHHLRRVRRRRRRGRAHRPRLGRHRGLLRADDLLRAADRRRRPGRDVGEARCTPPSPPR